MVPAQSNLIPVDQGRTYHSSHSYMFVVSFLCFVKSLLLSVGSQQLASQLHTHRNHPTEAHAEHHVAVFNNTHTVDMTVISFMEHGQTASLQ
jgi:hypothetical protein